MLYRIKLKNADDHVLLNSEVYEYLISDPYLSSVDFVNNLRKHSSGCAVFQKTTRQNNGDYKTKTIYLHKLIAEKFLSEQRTAKNNLVGTVNSNKLDCRLTNLVYRSRSVASRKRRSSSKLGYTGVYQESNRYRAVISVGSKTIHIGMYDSAEEAALAYNNKSRELFGENGKINIIRKRDSRKAKSGN